MKSIKDNNKKFDIHDFEKGLILAGLVPPSNISEFIERELLEEFEKKQAAKANNEKVDIPVIPIKTVSNVDYYKRTLLAAEIVHNLHSEYAFGHLKLQKLIYLSQRVENLDLPVNFLKQAMGPYDNKLMRSIDKQLLEKKWYQFNPKESLKYKPLVNAGQHKKDFIKYFGQQEDKIYWLIETFRKVKSDTIEIVATLFACWEELIVEGSPVTNDALLIKFYNWSKFKEKFPYEIVLQQKEWMINNGLYPTQKQ